MSTLGHVKRPTQTWTGSRKCLGTQPSIHIDDYYRDLLSDETRKRLEEREARRKK